MKRAVIKEHFDSIAESFDKYKRMNRFYHKAIVRFCKSVIPEGQRVLEIGSATGDLLNSLKPSVGVGIDFSPQMIEIAKSKYPRLRFFVMEAEHIEINENFDYIVMANLFEYCEDIWEVLENVKYLLSPDGKIIVITANPVWESVFRIGQTLRLRTPDTIRNFITNKDIVNLLELQNYETIKEGLRIFLPKYIPLLSSFLNFILPELPLLRQLCIIQYIVARPKRLKQDLSCSVVVPCHNEEGNIELCLKRIPKMGKFTEVVVVDDGSTDNTAMKVSPELNRDVEIKLITYFPNKGKGHAVKIGFSEAKGDVLIILDADMAVMPEELVRFFSLIENGLADFVNGTRVIYPMEKKSMPILNYFGNKIFSLIISWIMKQRISDTLCGTKAILKRDYKKILINDNSWGDFDLLFGAAKFSLKIREIPVHYKERIAGKSKMKVFKHGWILLNVCWKGFKELKLGI